MVYRCIIVSETVVSSCKIIAEIEIRSDCVVLFITSIIFVSNFTELVIYLG